MEKAGEEGEKDTITSINIDPCKWVQELTRAMLKCLGFEICSDHPSPPAAAHQISASSSSPSSYSGENGEDQKCAFQQLPIPADKDPPPPSTTDPPPQLIVSLSSRPPRPGLGNSGDPQTNDTSS